MIEIIEEKDEVAVADGTAETVATGETGAPEAIGVMAEVATEATDAGITRMEGRETAAGDSVAETDESATVATVGVSETAALAASGTADTARVPETREIAPLRDAPIRRPVSVVMRRPADVRSRHLLEDATSLLAGAVTSRLAVDVMILRLALLAGTTLRLVPIVGTNQPRPVIAEMIRPLRVVAVTTQLLLIVIAMIPPLLVPVAAMTRPLRDLVDVTTRLHLAGKGMTLHLRAPELATIPLRAGSGTIRRPIGVSVTTPHPFPSDAMTTRLLAEYARIPLPERERTLRPLEGNATPHRPGMTRRLLPSPPRSRRRRRSSKGHSPGADGLE